MVRVCGYLWFNDVRAGSLSLGNQGDKSSSINLRHLNKHTRHRATFFYTTVKLLILLGKGVLIGGFDSGNLKVLNFLGWWQSLSELI